MILLILVGVLALLVFFKGVATVQQGNIAVISMFGKYRRILYPDLNFYIPVIEQIYKTISFQNRSIELEFQAITIDQANVYFKSILL